MRPLEHCLAGGPLRCGASLLILLGGACRFAGPEGNPTDLVDVDEGPPGEGDGTGSDAEEDVDVAPSRADAGAVSSARDAGHAPIDSGVGGADGGKPTSASSQCAAPTTLDCNPVSGEGCLPLMQCVLDPAGSEPLAYCVFSVIQLDVICTQDEFSTDCPPQYTCVMGECRRYCACDSDCEDGAACSDPAGKAGSAQIKLCAR